MTQPAGFGSDGFRFAAQIRTLPGAAAPSTDREALADLVMAATLYLDRRDPEGKALARRRLQDALATSLVVLDSLQPDPPAVVCEPVILCTPVERSSLAEVLPGGAGGAGASRRDAPVTTQAGSLDSGLTDRGPSDAPAAPDAEPEPLPAREPIPEPAPDDTNAGGGAPADPVCVCGHGGGAHTCWGECHIDRYQDYAPWCPCKGFVGAADPLGRDEYCGWVDSVSRGHALEEVPDVTRPLALPRDLHGGGK